MSARSFATGMGLRAFLIACAVSLFGVSAAKADTVDLTFVKVSQWNGVTGVTNSLNNGVGQFNWTVGALSGGLAHTMFDGHSTAQTFCIETTQFTGSGITYTIQTSLLGLPYPGSGPGHITASKNLKLQALASLMSFDVLFKTHYIAPTVQAAIWHIVANDTYSYTYSLDNGDILVSAVNTLLTAVSNEETALANNLHTAQTFFWGLSSPSSSGGSGGNQDQIILVDTGGHANPPVPLPAGVVLAGVGIGCLGGVNFFRRRKAVVA